MKTQKIIEKEISLLDTIADKNLEGDFLRSCIATAMSGTLVWLLQPENKLMLSPSEILDEIVKEVAK